VRTEVEKKGKSATTMMMRRAAAKSWQPVLRGQHTRFIHPQGKRKEKLVILGSGWGAMSLLKALDQKRYDVYVVSPNTYFAMTPLLAQAATGTLELRAAMEPVRGNHKVHFYHAWVEAIDLQSQSLTLMPAYPPAFRSHDPLLHDDKGQNMYPNARGGHSTVGSKAPHRREIEADRVEHKGTDGHAAVGRQADSQEEGREYTLPYDKLVISVGAYNRTFNTPGVRENAWFLKDAQNARSIRWRILECFEQADHPDWSEEQRRKILTFLVVGGGPTGSEFAAELHDLIKTDLKRLYPKLAPLASISIIDASSGILNNFDASLSTYAREKFARDGIKLLLNRKVKQVGQGRLVVEPDGEIPFGLLVWSTGITASPLVESTTSIAKDPRNSFFLTDDRLHVLAAPSNSKPDEDLTQREDLRSIPNVWAIGDCAQVRQRPLPATAQVASQKGKHLAYVLNGQMGEDTTADESVFKHRNMGAMASLGGGSAIVDSPNAKAQGRIAWLIWRSAYTYMSMSWRNRLLVPFYWTINRIFGRDLTRF
jgi:NADH dehydrogenase